LDTAGFGDEIQWQSPPASAQVVEGWVHGRGAADSKVGASLFCHLTSELARDARRMHGTLVLMLDLDEHTGRFTGIRRYFDSNHLRPTGVYIGYPGNERIVTGGRGFLRAMVTVRGRAVHSGSSSRKGINAVVRAAQLVERLSALELPQDAGDTFPLPPSLTVTSVQGGEGFALVPDACTIRVDIRLTPRFTDRTARRLLREAVSALDRNVSRSLKSVIDWQAGWPAYRVPDESPLVVALRHAAERHLGRALPTAVAGPSNVGNYLASLRIPALCGFGVKFEGIHAPNERFEIASVAPAYLAYRDAVRSLFRMS
jgi:succinyl-diaminopimelate desuccinylase